MSLGQTLERLALRWLPALSLRALTLAPHALGLAGEEWVAHVLRRRGWRILGRRWVTPYGEVDIVAREGSVLVLVEVKTGRMRGTLRTTHEPLIQAQRATEHVPWRPGSRCGPDRVARLERAGCWLRRRMELRDLRVDLVEVLVHSGGGWPQMVHWPRFFGWGVGSGSTGGQIDRRETT